jgi:hypothetical protein
MSSVDATAVVVPALPPDADIVDDFNDGDDTDYWDGAMGAMEDGVNSIVRSFATLDAYSGSGRSLKLAYDFSTTTATWNGYFLNLNNLSGVTKDISAYQQLNFWVRSEALTGTHLKIGLENTSGAGRNKASLYVNDYLDGGITNVWQKVTIPLDAFANLDLKTNVKTLTFVFERSYANTSGMSLAGAVFIDAVRFSSISAGALRVDHFGDKWGANSLGGNIGDLTTSTQAIASSSFDLITPDSFPYSFKSMYNVDFLPPNQDWSGHFFIFGGGSDGWTSVPVNLSAYSTLRFSAKAVAGGNPVRFKIEVLSGVNLKAEYVVDGISSSGWGPYSVTLSLPAAGTIDKTKVKQMNFVYEKWRIDSAPLGTERAPSISTRLSSFRSIGSRAVLIPTPLRACGT